MTTSSLNRSVLRDARDTSVQPVYFRAAPDRRNVRTREALVSRVRSEFEEMPGVSLTLSTAARLFGVEPDVCERILIQLADEGLLRRTADDRYSVRVDTA